MLCKSHGAGLFSAGLGRWELKPGADRKRGAAMALNAD